MDEPQRYEQFPIRLFNSLSRSVEPFEALEPPFVGLYVCGPTVYSDPHLGHARSAIVFDVLFRFLRFVGYRVRYVRNITDVGHLEDEQAGAGEDRIAKRARLERIEPMEVVQRYSLSYRNGLARMGCEPPSIEPSASGHIPEQIEVIERILDQNLAYESGGSVYFDLGRYTKESGADPAVAAAEAADRTASPYGRLSGRIFDDLVANTRETAGSQEKKGPLDFALWKRAEPQHIMRWKSPWGEGFPGWHLECTTMSTKYLGESFDIHGGGLDLQFPHHEAEIAQSHAAFCADPARYWVHTNMLTVDGQKMARSTGNFITLEQMFSGQHQRLDRGYAPMVLRFFMLQSHYRSTVDFSSEALNAAERGYQRLMNGLAVAESQIDGLAAAPADGDPIAAAGARLMPVQDLETVSEHERAIVEQVRACWEAISDDLHTPKLIAALFELGRLIQRPEHAAASETLKQQAALSLSHFVRQVLGLQPDGDSDAGSGEQLDAAMTLLIELRAAARANRDFATADRIRDELAAAGLQLEDGRDGTRWARA